MVFNKKVKTGILIIFLFIMGLTLKAQSIAEASELYNEGVELVNQDKLQEALDKFMKTVEMCEALDDEEAIETKMTAEGVIPGVQYRIASNYLQESDFENGIPALEKSIELADEYNDFTTKGQAEERLSQVYLVYATNLFQQKKYEEADATFDKVLDLDADYAQAYMFKALIYRQQGDLEKFKSNIEQAITSAQKTNDRKTLNRSTDFGFKVYLKQGVDAFSSNNFDECIENTNIALTFVENDVDALTILIQAYSKKGDWDKTIETGKKALAGNITDQDKKARVYYEMATAYKEKGDNNAACEHYKKAMVGQYVENAKYQREHILKCTD